MFAAASIAVEGSAYFLMRSQRPLCLGNKSPIVPMYIPKTFDHILPLLD